MRRAPSEHHGSLEVSNFQEYGCDRPNIPRLRTYPHIPNGIWATSQRRRSRTIVSLLLLCGPVHESWPEVASPRWLNSRSSSDVVYVSPTILSIYLRSRTCRYEREVRHLVEIAFICIENFHTPRLSLPASQQVVPAASDVPIPTTSRIVGDVLR